MSDDGIDTPGAFGAVLRWAERHPQLVDAALALGTLGLLAPSSMELVMESALDTSWQLVLAAGVLMLHGAMFSRRSHPLISYAAGCAGMLLFTVSPYLGSVGAPAVPAPLLPSALLFFVLLYTAAEHTSSRWAGGALAVALLGGVLVLARLSFGRPWWSQVTGQGSGSAWLVLTALIVAGAVGAFSLGRLRRTRRAYLAELQHRARRTEADRIAEAAEAADGERRRIAREMHDVVSHSLAVMISQAEGGRMLSSATSADRAPAQSAPVFATIADTGRAAMADMRAMLGVLREPEAPAPVTRGPQPGLVDVAELVDQVRSTGCDVTLDERGVPSALSPSAELAVYRLLQESLTNVVKHAGAGASARVRLDWRPHELRVEVLDDGQPGPPGPGGAGLLGMRERVATVGGTLEVGPAQSWGGLDEAGDHRTSGAETSHGWRVAATIPVPRRGASS